MTRVKPLTTPSMHPHEFLLRRLFEALAAGDAGGAARCYHPEVFFTDPLFPRLRGADVAHHWRVVFQAVHGWRLEVRDIAADEDGGRAAWTARCAWREREIAIEGRSLFAFRDGLVCRHYDQFSFWRWSAAAFGPLGAALGWLGPFRWAVRQKLARHLERAETGL